MQQTAPAAAADHHQLQALRLGTEALLSRLGVEEDAKLADWLRNEWGCCSSATRQCCIVCCMILKKPARIKLCHIFIYGCMLFLRGVPPIWMFHGSGAIRKLLKWGKLKIH
jgi:tRNA/rRNA methyltransferase